MIGLIKKSILFTAPLLVLAGLSIWQYSILWQGGSCKFLSYFPTCNDPSSGWLAAALLLASFSLWLIFYFRLWPALEIDFIGKTSLAGSVVLMIAVLALALSVNQFATGDPEYYYNVGRAVHYQINPYVQEYAGGNPFLASANPIMPAGVMYGPALLRIFSAGYEFSAGGLYAFVIMLKAAMLAVFLLCAWLIARLAGEKRYLAFAWLLSPLAIFEWLSNGHFDGIWLAMVLGACLAAATKRWWLVWPLLALAVWLKFVPLIFAPILLLWWWQEFDRRRAGDYCQLAVGALLTLAVTLFAWRGLWAGPAVFGGILLQMKWAMHSIFFSLYYGAANIIGAGNERVYHYLLSGGLQLALLAFAAWLIWPLIAKAGRIFLRREKFSPAQYSLMAFVGLSAYLLIIQKSLWPWYFIWPLPFGLIAASEISAVQLKRLLVWFGAAPLLFYVFWFVGDSQMGDYRFAVSVCLMMAAYPLYLLISWRREGFSLPADGWQDLASKLLRLPLGELARLGYSKTKPLHGQFIKYFITGVSAFVLDMLTLYALKEWLGLTPTWATVCNQFLMLNFVFFINKFWSFKAAGITHRQMVRYLIVALANYLFAVAWMFVFNHMLQFNYLLVRAVNIMLAVSWNFLLYRYFVYKD